MRIACMVIFLPSQNKEYRIHQWTDRQQTFHAHVIFLRIELRTGISNKEQRIKNPSVDGQATNFARPGDFPPYRTQNSERRTQNSELRTQNSELRTQNAELRTQNPELKTLIIKLLSNFVIQNETYILHFNSDFNNNG